MNSWPTLEVRADKILARATMIMLRSKLGDVADQTRPLAVGFVRIIARAIRSYERAKENVESEVLLQMLDGAGDIEECIFNLHRSLLFLDALRKKGITTADAIPVSLKAKDFFVNSADVRQRLTAMRDAIAHMEERICRAKFTEKTPTAAHVRDGRIVLDDAEFSLLELTSWLNQTGQVAMHLVTHGAAGRAGAV